MALISYFKMEGTTDNVGGRTLSNAVGTPSIVQGMVNNCYSFSGSNALAVSDSYGFGSSSAFTYSVWIYADSYPANEYVLSNYINNSGNIVHYIYIYSGGTNLMFGDDVQNGGTSALIPGVSIAAGKWHHLVHTSNGGTSGSRKRRAWINGKLVASLDNATITAGSTSATANRIGVYNNGLGNFNYFTGRVDEVQVYNDFKDGSAFVKNLYAFHKGYF